MGMLPFRPAPFFADKDRAFWRLQFIGWGGSALLRAMTNIANGKPEQIVLTLIAAVTGFSISLILAVVYTLGAIMTPREGVATGERRTDRQMVGTVVAGLYVLLVALCFAYFYPIFVGQLIPYESWQSRMWLGSRWV